MIEVSVADARTETLTAALNALDGLLTVVVRTEPDTKPTGSPNRSQALTVQVVGNDHPGIVREISGVLSRQALSIESMTSQTRDAAMAGGRLFEATVVATVPASADPEALRAELERLAADLQVDIAVA